MKSVVCWFMGTVFAFAGLFVQVGGVVAASDDSIDGARAPLNNATLVLSTLNLALVILGAALIVAGAFLYDSDKAVVVDQTKELVS